MRRKPSKADEFIEWLKKNRRDGISNNIAYDLYIDWLKESTKQAKLGVKFHFGSDPADNSKTYIKKG